MAALIGQIAEWRAFEAYRDSVNSTPFSRPRLLQEWVSADTEARGATPRRWGRGWTIGGWFIPVVNLIIPKLVIGEVEKAAASLGSDGRIGIKKTMNWQQAITSGTGWLWWVLLLGGQLLVRLGAAYIPDADTSLRAATGELRLSYFLYGLGMTATAIGLVFGFVHIGWFAQRLTRPVGNPEGWYPDPADSKRRRRWDGNAWTHHYRTWSGHRWVQQSWVDGAWRTSSWDGERWNPIDDPQAPTEADPKIVAAGREGTDPRNPVDALRQLKALHDEGILTDAEYESKRQRLADQL